MAVVDPIPTAKATAARSATPFALFQARQPWRINASMLTLHHNVLVQADTGGFLRSGQIRAPRSEVGQTIAFGRLSPSPRLKAIVDLEEHDRPRKAMVCPT